MIKVALDCFPCFLRQVVISLRQVSVDREKEAHIIKAVLDDIKHTDINLTPAHTTTFIHRKVRQLLSQDPFKEIKRLYNDKAIAIYPQLKRMVDDSSDPLWTSVRLAIAGNIIDFGIYTKVNIDSEIERALNERMPIDEYNTFRERLSQAKKVLYLLDNAGEIVFDRVLIETIKSMGKDVVAVVKGGPVINDVTMEDAVTVGLDKVCTIIDNGSDAIGTIIDWCSESFRTLFSKSSFVISKGQGNFETLLNTKKEIFFLFQAKCDVVADYLNVEKGSMLLYRQ